MMPLIVNEIFYSIQGESAFCGMPCAFVRLTGCNLRCRYCDTTYAFEEGERMDIETISRKIRSFQAVIIEITGGEPLIQDETPDMIRHFLNEKYTVLLETNGTLDIGGVEPDCVKILDIKCPSSNESEKNNWNNLRYLNQKDQVKFVIGDRIDYEFAKKTISLVVPIIPRTHILFSPAVGFMKPDQLAEWILDDRLQVRINLQLHKIIWPGKDRGV